MISMANRGENEATHQPGRRKRRHVLDSLRFYCSLSYRYRAARFSPFLLLLLLWKIKTKCSISLLPSRGAPLCRELHFVKSQVNTTKDVCNPKSLKWSLSINPYRFEIGLHFNDLLTNPIVQSITFNHEKCRRKWNGCCKKQKNVEM